MLCQVRHKVLAIGLGVQTCLRAIEHESSVLQAVLYDDRQPLHHEIDHPANRRTERATGDQDTTTLHEHEYVLHEEVVAALRQSAKGLAKRHISSNVEGDEVEVLGNVDTGIIR